MHMIAMASCSGSICRPCEWKNQVVAADFFCRLCNDWLCGVCKENYCSFQRGKHDIVGKEEKRRHGSARLVSNQGLRMCTDHNRPIQSFCKTHRQLCCSICTDNVHIPPVCVIQQLGTVSNEELRDEYKRTKREFEKNISAYQANDIRFEDATGKLNKLLEEANELIDTFQNLLKKTNTFKDKSLNLRKTSGVLINEMKMFDVAVNKCLQGQNEKENFVISHKLERFEGRCQSLSDSLNDINNQLRLASELTDDTTAMLQSRCRHARELFIRGQEEQGYQNDSTLYKFVLTKNMDSLFGPLQIEQILKKDLRPDFQNVTHEPQITAIETLPGNRLIALDAVNKKGWIFNMDLQKIGTKLFFKETPRDVTVMNEKEIAVTVSESDKLQFIKIIDVRPPREKHTTSKFKHVSKIKISFPCDAICRTPYSKFLVSTINCAEPFYEVDKEGRAEVVDGLKDLQLFSSFCDCKCVYDDSNSKLYFTNTETDTVYIYDTIYKEQIKVKDRSIIQPRGIALGAQGTMFICSSGNDSIVYMSDNGKIIDQFKVEVRKPQYVCSTKDRKRLVVYSDFIMTVYNVSYWGKKCDELLKCNRRPMSL